MNSNTICVKKTFPAKYLKYLSYGIHIMKQLYPADEEYQQKVAEYLKFSESVNVIIDDIESSLTDDNETEVKELKKSLAKKPKRIRNKTPTNTITLTEQIVELANEPTIKRGPVDEVEYVIAMSDSEGEEEVKVVAEVKETPKKVTKPKKAKVVKPEVVEEVVKVVEEVKVVVEEVKVVVEVVKVVEEVVKVVEEVVKVVEEVVKPVAKKVTKKVKKADIDDDLRPTPTWVEPPAEITVSKVVVKEQLDVEVPKKVSKPRVKKVVDKKPEEVQQPVVVMEELTEENEV